MKGKYSTELRHYEKIAGTARVSQSLGPYGPGAMVDLVNDAVLVAGTHLWPRGRIVSCERILRRVKGRLASVGSSSRSQWLLASPYPIEDPHKVGPGDAVPVYRFPNWFRCEKCSKLARYTAFEEDKASRRFRHLDCQSDCIPVRFVTACEHGHLDEVPWAYLCHFGKEESCKSKHFTLREEESGDFLGVSVQCNACGVSNPLASFDRLGWRCNGKCLWNGTQEPCTAKSKLLLRAAVNAHFPVILSAIKIDTTRVSPLKQEVRNNWPNYADVVDEKEAASAMKYGQMDPALKLVTTPRALLEIVDEVRPEREAPVSGSLKKDENTLRQEEFDALLASTLEPKGMRISPFQDFVAFRNQEAEEKVRGFGIERVVLVHRLSEVRALVGLTRLQPMMADIWGELTNVKMAPIADPAEMEWVPAIEDRGEGIFFSFSNEKLTEWENTAGVRARELLLEAGFNQHMTDRKLDEKGLSFFGPSYYFLHTLSHLLMQSISLSCGYAASAIRERIYCAPKSDKARKAGILLYTTSSGAEGTLGGLIEEGNRLDVHLRDAVLRARICSNDPVCSRHRVGRHDREERFLEGAACYACLYAPESSCERFNQFLDRALVVPCLHSEDASTKGGASFYSRAFLDAIEREHEGVDR